MAEKNNQETKLRRLDDTKHKKGAVRSLCYVQKELSCT